MSLIHWLVDAAEMATVIEAKRPGLKFTLTWDATGAIATADLDGRRARRHVSWPAVKGSQFNPILSLLHLAAEDLTKP